MSVLLFQGFVPYYRAPSNVGFKNVAVHLAVAGDVFGGVLFSAVLFPHKMSWMRSGTEPSQFLRIFPTYCLKIILE